MAILEKEVWVTLNPMNINHYKDLKYINDSNKKYKGMKISVKIDDLPKGSHMRVTKICDICADHVLSQTYQSILKYREKGDGKDRCRKCAVSFRAKRRKDNVKYENSFECHAVKNGLIDLLEHYSEKNINPPSKISKGNTDEYIWKCKDCNSEYKMSLNAKLQSGVVCSYCDGRKVNHTNCLWATHPEIARLLKNKKRGYEISKGSHSIEEFVCENCGNIDKKVVYSASFYGVKCSKCSDGISYPEKFLISMLSQTGMYFEKEKVFDWSKKVKTKNTTSHKRYDFYIPSLNMIIETHGGNHYNETGFSTIGGKCLDEEIENDKVKHRIALENGVNEYIILNCKKSEFEYIKESIKNSKLNNYIDLSEINWLKCHEFACKSLVKEACDLYNVFKNITIIAEKLNLTCNGVRNYIKQGSILGWCEYIPNNTRRVVQLSLKGSYIKEWESIAKAKESILDSNHISSVCRGERKTSGGFKWMYKEDYEKYIEEQNESINLENELVIHNTN